VTGAIAGDANTAVQLDGTNDHVTASRTATSDFSVELWFRSSQGIGTGTSWESGAGLFSADLTGTATDFGLSLRSDGRVVGGIGATSVVSGTGGHNNGAWHHVVLTRQAGAAIVVYVDGVATTGAVSTGTVSGTAAVSLGRIQSSATNYLQGALDEVAIYSTVLSAATVSNHYTTGTTP
jgi:hypothetical protein